MMTKEEYINSELTPFMVRDCNITNDNIMTYFNVSGVTYKHPSRHKLYFITKDSEYHEIIGETGSVVGVMLASGVDPLNPKYFKWFDEGLYDRGEILEELKRKFK